MKPPSLNFSGLPVLPTSIGLSIVIAAVDYATRSTLPLSVLYILPAIWAVFNRGLGAGLLITFLAASLELTISYFINPTLFQTLQFYGSYLIYFTTVLAITLIAHWAKKRLDQTTFHLEQCVSERTRQLNESASLLRRMLDGTSDLIVVKDRQGRYLHCNEAAAKFLGSPINEVIGRDVSAFLPEGKSSELMESDRSLMENGTSESLVEETLNWDGKEIFFLSKKSVFRDEDGKIAGLVKVARDITQIKKTEAALRESESRWQFAIDGSDEGVWDWNFLEGKFFYSTKWKSMLGYAENEVGNTLEDWLYRVHPSDLIRCQTKLEEHYQGKASTYFSEYRMKSKDGNWRWVSARGKLISRSTDGKPLRIIGTHTDITERKVAENRIRQLNTRMNLAVSTGKIGIFEINLESGQVLYNEQMHEIYGLGDSDYRTGIPPETFGGNREQWLEIVHPDDLPKVREMLIQIPDSRNILKCRYRIIRPDGEMRHISAVVQIMRDATDKPVFAIGTIFDITEHQTLNDALSNEKERLELATQVSGIGVWELDLQTLALKWDARMHEMFGISEAEFSHHQQDWVDCLHPDDRDKTYVCWKKAVESNSIFDTEFRIIHKGTGEIRHVRALARYIRDRQGSAKYSIGINWDVTEERRASEILTQAKEAAEAGEKAKSEFMASISHEIRTPMNGIMGMAELLLDTSLSDSQREMVSIVHRSSENLLVIINDILDYSKIEAGKMRLHDAPFNPELTITDTIQLLGVQAAKKNLHLTCEVSPNLKTTLFGDADRIKQVVTNLVGNAIKFTEQGSVSVRARVTTKASDHLSLLIEIQDTGIGIPAHMQSKLFQPFNQADQSDSRRFGGSGLGLAISDEIARAMGGQLTFESTENVGSVFRFYITLPFFKADSNHPAPLENPGPLEIDAAFRSLHLLLVEDNEANQRVASLMLEQFGHTVSVASDGLIALDILKHQSFDAILLDCQMPGIDGYETARRIRSGESGAQDSSVPIIALTAAGMPGDRERCLEAGMNDYTLKPLNRKSLSEAFARCGLVLLDPATPPRTTETEHQETEAPAISQVLDTERLEQLRELGKSARSNLLQKVISLMLEDTPVHLEEISTHLETPDFDEIAKTTHKLAGSCSSIGAPALQTAIQTLERSAKDQDLTTAKTHFVQVMEEWQRLKSKLSEMATSENEAVGHTTSAHGS